MNRHRPNWPAILVWGAGFAASATVAGAAIMPSWHTLGLAVASALALPAVILLAISVFEGD